MAIGRTKRSYFGGLRVKPSPTKLQVTEQLVMILGKQLVEQGVKEEKKNKKKNIRAAYVALVTSLFQLLVLCLPVLTTLNISSSAIPRTFGRGTFHLPAFSLRFCLIMLERIFARCSPSRSKRYAGTAPS